MIAAVEHLRSTSLPKRRYLTLPSNHLKLCLNFPGIASLMWRVASSTRTRVVISALSGLERLQREMARVSQKSSDYESRRRALGITIQELRKSLCVR